MQATKIKMKQMCGQTSQMCGKNNHRRTQARATTYTATQATNARADALMFPSSCLGGGITRVGPGQYPQYNRADFGPEAVGCSCTKHHKSPNVKLHGRVKSRMVAELSLVFRGHDPACNCNATT